MKPYILRAFAIKVETLKVVSVLLYYFSISKYPNKD